MISGVSEQRGPSLPGLAPGNSLGKEHAGRNREDDEGHRKGADTGGPDLVRRHGQLSVTLSIATGRSRAVQRHKHAGQNHGEQR